MPTYIMNGLREALSFLIYIPVLGVLLYIYMYDEWTEEVAISCPNCAINSHSCSYLVSLHYNEWAEEVAITDIVLFNLHSCCSLVSIHI